LDLDLDLDFDLDFFFYFFLLFLSLWFSIWFSDSLFFKLLWWLIISDLNSYSPFKLCVSYSLIKLLAIASRSLADDIMSRSLDL
jgi:hypothetical protein